MGRRGKNEFSKEVKDEIYRLQRHKFPKDAELEFDHIASVRQCRELGIPWWIISSSINCQLLTKEENRKKADKDAPEAFINMLLSLITRMI